MHDTPHTHYTLWSTRMLAVILFDKAPFSQNDNRHIQPVNLYLWHKEEYDFDCVILAILIVEGKITDTQFVHGRSIAFI